MASQRSNECTVAHSVHSSANGVAPHGASVEGRLHTAPPMGLNMWDEIHESPCRRDTSNQRVLNSARRALGHIHNTRHGAKE